MAPKPALAMMDILKLSEKKFTLNSDFWLSYPGASHSWISVKADDAAKTVIPDVPGVYTFVVRPDVAGHSCEYLMYVGKAEKQSLRKRFMQYLREQSRDKGRVPIQDIFRTFPEHLHFCYVTLVNPKIISNLEKQLLEAFVPPCNQQLPGELQRARAAF